MLVLVDGRRWVKGSSGSGVSGAVDLNSIPANAIKSIEILQDGASAIYGSDAIGGVMNIITADDYDTFKISGYTGQYGDGDGETAEFDMRMGASGERGRALVDISYTNQKAVNTADRDDLGVSAPRLPVRRQLAAFRRAASSSSTRSWATSWTSRPTRHSGSRCTRSAIRTRGDFHEFRDGRPLQLPAVQPPGDAERALQRIREG